MGRRAREQAGRAPGPSRARARLLVALTVASWSLPARADVALSPAPGGRIGALLLARAPSAIPVESVGRPTLGGPVAGAPLRLASAASGTLDLAHELPGARFAVAAVVLSLPSSLDGWLLLSADGAVAVAIDGTVAFRRDTPHARGESVDPIPVSLSPGEHVLALSLRRDGSPWALSTRIVARATLAPPPGMRLLVPGASSESGARLAGDLATVVVDPGLGPTGWAPRLSVTFPAGVPVAPGVTVRVEAARADGSTWTEQGAPTFDRDGAPGVDFALPPAVTEGRAGTTVRVAIGARLREVALALPPDAPSIVARARALEAALGRERRSSGSVDPGAAVATIEGEVRALVAAAAAAGPAASRHAAALDELVTAVDAGRDPLSAPGVHAFHLPSPVDGAPEPVSLHVPAGYRPGAPGKFPLVVVLHGKGGTPERAMAAFLGDGKGPHPRVDGFVVAPHGHGDAFYRGPGEEEVMHTIDWVTGAFPIDPARVSITGVSMGGTGAAHLALHHPDRFAALATLAGYHSYFVRGDVAGRRLREWERVELARFSPASFAENAGGLRVLVAQGTRDLPLVHSRVLAERLRALGHPHEERWPDAGHDVERVVWADAALYPWLAAARTSARSRIVLEADSLRHGTREWARITRLSGAGAGQLDATIDGAAHVTARARGLDAFEIDRRAPGLGTTGAVELVVDGTALRIGGGEPVAAHREAGAWVAGRPAETRAVAKRAGLEGPIRDVVTGPSLFVYGTLDPAQMRAAREVAEHFRARWCGDARPAVIPDTALTPDLAARHSLFLVGSPAANRVVRALDARLPIGLDRGEARLGAVRVAGDQELGLLFVYPNPEHPDRYVALLEARDVRGLYRALSLPQALPDFIVFDSGVREAAGQQVLGPARVLAAGHFDPLWSLPMVLADAPALPRRGAPARRAP